MKDGCKCFGRNRDRVDEMRWVLHLKNKQMVVHAEYCANFIFTGSCAEVASVLRFAKTSFSGRRSITQT